MKQFPDDRQLLNRKAQMAAKDIAVKQAAVAAAVAAAAGEIRVEKKEEEKKKKADSEFLKTVFKLIPDRGQMERRRELDPADERDERALSAEDPDEILVVETETVEQ